MNTASSYHRSITDRPNRSIQRYSGRMPNIRAHKPAAPARGAHKATRARHPLACARAAPVRCFSSCPHSLAHECGVFRLVSKTP